MSAAADRLRALPAEVQAIVASADDAAVRARPAVDEWSAVEVVGHLLDKMRVWRGRVERIAHEERPFLPGYDQDAYVRERGYLAADSGSLVNDLREACERFADIVEALPAAALRRQGVHGEDGPITLEQCIWRPIDSAAAHLAQMRAAIAAGQGRASGGDEPPQGG